MGERDYTLEIARANARLRAWRSFGVPVDGGWDQQSPGWGLFHLDCDACDYNSATLHRPVAYSDPEAVVIMAERAAIERGCPHLAPMLAEPPPGFADVVALELLAGEGGR